MPLQRFAIVPLALLSLCRCASTPVATDPAWISRPTRTVDSGYIVYVGKGEDSTLERAQFKAEASALQDLANECSLLPKGTRVEDRFDRKEGYRYQSFTKVGLTFEECDAAKRAVEPGAIRELANTELTARIKMFLDLLLPARSETTAAAQASPQGNFVEYHADESASGGWAPDVTIAGAADSSTVRDGDELLVQRQRIVAAKTDVILSPAGRFAQGSSESAAFVQTVTSVSSGVRRFESSHPQTKTWTRGWSSLPLQVRSAPPNFPSVSSPAPSTTVVVPEETPVTSNGLSLPSKPTPTLGGLQNYQRRVPASAPKKGTSPARSSRGRGRTTPRSKRRR